MALFIGRLSLDTHPRDLEHIFDKYGRLNRLEVKRGYAFVEYQDERDASDAMKETDGLAIGQRTVVHLEGIGVGAGVQEEAVCPYYNLQELLDFEEPTLFTSELSNQGGTNMSIQRPPIHSNDIILIRPKQTIKIDMGTECFVYDRSRSRSPRRSLTPRRDRDRDSRDRDDRYYKKYSDDERSRERRHSGDDRRLS
ncbi:14102_t:CDS:2, partial [Cetraspora pellucida]